MAGKKKKKDVQNKEDLIRRGRSGARNAPAVRGR